MIDELDIDQPIMWDIIDQGVHITNIGTMDIWKPSDIYVVIGNGVYRHYLKSNSYLASLDDFIKANHLEGTWQIEIEGSFPTKFINIFNSIGGNARDMSQIIKGLDMAYRRGALRLLVKSFSCMIKSGMMRCVIIFDNYDMGIINCTKVIDM